MLHDREFRESKTVQDARSSFVQGKLFLIQSVKNDVAFIWDTSLPLLWGLKFIPASWRQLHSLKFGKVFSVYTSLPTVVSLSTQQRPGSSQTQISLSPPVEPMHSIMFSLAYERELLIMLLFSLKQNYSTEFKSSWLTKAGRYSPLCQFDDAIRALFYPSIIMSFLLSTPNPSFCCFPCYTYTVQFTPR